MADAKNVCPREQVGQFKPNFAAGKVTASFDGKAPTTRELAMNSRQVAERMFDPILRFLNDKEDVPKREIARALGILPATKRYRSDLNYALQLLKKQKMVRQTQHGWSPTTYYGGKTDER